MPSDEVVIGLKPVTATGALNVDGSVGVRGTGNGCVDTTPAGLSGFLRRRLIVRRFASEVTETGADVVAVVVWK